jgi:hypothetical protein
MNRSRLAAGASGIALLVVGVAASSAIAGGGLSGVSPPPISPPPSVVVTPPSHVSPPLVPQSPSFQALLKGCKSVTVENDLIGDVTVMRLPSGNTVNWHYGKAPSYFQKVDWCYAGGVITELEYSHWVDGSKVFPNAYFGATLLPIHVTGGVGQFSAGVRSSAWICALAPVAFSCIQNYHWYPRIETVVRADGHALGRPSV